MCESGDLWIVLLLSPCLEAWLSSVGVSGSHRGCLSLPSPVPKVLLLLLSSWCVPFQHTPSPVVGLGGQHWLFVLGGASRRWQSPVPTSSFQWGFAQSHPEIFKSQRLDLSPCLPSCSAEPYLQVAGCQHRFRPNK